MPDEPIDPTVPPSGSGCVECLPRHDGGSTCGAARRCGHIGCCDSSPSQHASNISARPGHSVIRSFEPGEGLVLGLLHRGSPWRVPQLAPPENHPLDQPVPGPAAASHATGNSTALSMPYTTFANVDDYIAAVRRGAARLRELRAIIRARCLRLRSDQLRTADLQIRVGSVYFRRGEAPVALYGSAMNALLPMNYRL